MKAMKTKDMTLIAVMAALICVAGPLSIPVGPIPLSLATFAVYLAGSVLGRKKGTIAVALYLVIGVIGAEKREKAGWWFHPLMMVAGTVLLYLVGTIVFMLHTGNGLIASLSLCVIPFLIGDAIKIAAATLLTVPVRKAVKAIQIHNS